jgi:hypothetical protein
MFTTLTAPVYPVLNTFIPLTGVTYRDVTGERIALVMFVVVALAIQFAKLICVTVVTGSTYCWVIRLDTIY